MFLRAFGDASPLVNEALALRGDPHDDLIPLKTAYNDEVHRLLVEYDIIEAD